MDVGKLNEGRQKAIFHDKYRCQGLWEEDIKAEHDKMYRMTPDGHGPDLENMPPLTLEGIDEYKSTCRYFYNELNSQQELLDVISLCDQKEVTIPKKGFGHDAPVRMLVHIPKDLAAKTDNACIINAHGGGAIAGSPELEAPICCYIAVKNNVVVFNVEYRLAGSGAKANQMAGDIVQSIKYIRENAAYFGVDPARICLYGYSGGGYAISAACSLLAQKKQSNLVRFVILNMYIAPAYFYTDEKEKMPHRQAREAFYDGPFVAKQYASNVDKQFQKKDPILFPTLASDDLLKRWPATILISAEWDPYVIANNRFSRRLKRNNRLLENIVYPGANHAFFLNFNFKLTQSFWADYKKLLKAYLHA